MKYNLSLTTAQWRNIVDVLIMQITTDVECLDLVDVMCQRVVSFGGEFNLSFAPAQWLKIVDALIEQTAHNREYFSLVSVMCNFSVSFEDNKEG